MVTYLGQARAIRNCRSSLSNPKVCVTGRAAEGFVCEVVHVVCGRINRHTGRLYGCIRRRRWHWSLFQRVLRWMVALAPLSFKEKQREWDVKVRALCLACWRWRRWNSSRLLDFEHGGWGAGPGSARMDEHIWSSGELCSGAVAPPGRRTPSSTEASAGPFDRPSRAELCHRQCWM